MPILSLTWGLIKMEEEFKAQETYKYKRTVTIELKSNNFPKIQKMAADYFSVKIPKHENDPDDLQNYVAINRVMSQ